LVFRHFVEEPAPRMATIILKLHPEHLENPDADLRYIVPDILAERSEGVIWDSNISAFDYLEGTNEMVLYLEVMDVARASQVILETLAGERIMGNDLLPGCTVAIERADGYEVIFPPDFAGEFTVPKD
jgi:hypothetical protein